MFSHLIVILAISVLGARGFNPVPRPSRTGPSTALCSQYAYLKTNGYEILNNLWGIDTATGGSQCTYYYGAAGLAVAFGSSWTWQGNDNTVKSYIYANRVFDRKLVSDISSLPTTVEWTYNRTDIRANVAYDIFTHTDVNHVNSNGDYELMIWLDRYGGIWPITESPTGSPVGNVTLAGYDWELYMGWNGAMRVYSFLPAKRPYHTFTADAKVFFDYLTAEYAFPADKQYMLIYNFGTEAFTGGPALFDVPLFQAEVQ